MKKFSGINFAVLIWVITFASCSSPEEKMKSQIQELESGLYADSSMVPDTGVSGKIIDMYISYAEKFPNDTLSPVYLFKAGDVASKMNETHRAIEIFDNLKKNFPEHRNAPYALFLQGFICETQEGNPAKARPYYEEFLKKYPDHPIVSDVAFSLENLGKTPEELILEFEKNNAAQVSAETTEKTTK